MPIRLLRALQKSVRLSLLRHCWVRLGHSQSSLILLVLLGKVWELNYCGCTIVIIVLLDLLAIVVIILLHNAL